MLQLVNATKLNMPEKMLVADAEQLHGLEYIVTKPMVKTAFYLTKLMLIFFRE